MWRVLLRNVSSCGEMHSLSFFLFFFFFFNGEQKTGRVVAFFPPSREQEVEPSADRK